MTETPEENPFESPRGAAALANEAWSARGFWIAGGATVIISVFMLPFVPGLAVLIALVNLPALVWAGRRVRREVDATGRVPATADQMLLVSLGVLVTLLLLSASGMAFFTFCLGGFAVAETIQPSRDYGATNLLIAGLPLGSIAGLVVFFFLFRWSLGKKWTPRKVTGETGVPGDDQTDSPEELPGPTKAVQDEQRE